MKKITLAVLFLASSLAFSQELPIDFDDQNDVFAPFNGAATSTIDDNGDNVLQMVGAMNAWDGATITFANLVDLSDDSNNTVTFMVKPSSASGTHLLKFEENVGGVGPADTQLDFTTTGTDWQMISVDFGAGLGQYGKMSIFPDRGDANAGIAETYLFDDFDGVPTVARPAAANPTDAPAAPTADAADVTSLYSDAYTDAPSNNNPGWGENITPEMHAGNNVFKTTNFLPFVLNPPIDITAHDMMHVDIWLNAKPGAGAGILIKLLDAANGPHEAHYTEPFANITEGSWNSIDIPISSFNQVAGTWDAAARASIDQVLVDIVDDATMFVDNVYFYTSSGGGGGGGAGAPTDPAPDAPTFANANDVSSIFSSLGNITGLVTNTFVNAVINTVQIGGDDVIKLEIPEAGGGGNFIWGPPTNLNTNGLTHLFFHYYTEAVGVGKVLNFQVQGGGANFIHTIALPAARNTGWQTVNVALSSLANYDAGQLENISQIQVVGAGPSNPIGDVYIDNLMLYKGGTASTDDNSLIESLVMSNPTDNEWKIRTSNANIKSVSVFNILGKQVYSATINRNEVAIPARNLNSGIYIARIQTELGVKSIKLVRK